METPESNPVPASEGTPPIFKSWKQMYIFVLAMHVLLITLFYFFTRAYS